MAEKPFTICSECGSPILTSKQEKFSLCVFFTIEKDRAEFKEAIEEANPKLKAYDY